MPVKSTPSARVVGGFGGCGLRRFGELAAAVIAARVEVDGGLGHFLFSRHGDVLGDDVALPEPPAAVVQAIRADALAGLRPQVVQQLRAVVERNQRRQQPDVVALQLHDGIDAGAFGRACDRFRAAAAGARTGHEGQRQESGG